MVDGSRGSKWTLARALRVAKNHDSSSPLIPVCLFEDHCGVLRGGAEMGNDVSHQPCPFSSVEGAVLPVHVEPDIVSSSVLEEKRCKALLRELAASVLAVAALFFCCIPPNGPTHLVASWRFARSVLCLGGGV